jgi:phenylacetic acid degradation protein
VPSYSLEGVVPVVHPSAFVHPQASLIGDVVIGPACYVGPFASLRGDFGRIQLEAGSNVQDSATLHCFPGRTMLVERDGHIGHGAVLHGAHIGVGVLVGINAVVMDGVEVGEYAFIGAHSFVPADMQIPPRTVVSGTPARVRRELTDAELAWKANGTAVYQHLAQRCSAELRLVEPLEQLEPGRPSLSVGRATARPLKEFRAAAHQPVDG